MMKRIESWLCVILLCAATPALAQSEYSMRGATNARDLELPTEPSPIAAATLPRMALFKPDGAGPFPALVLLHQCGGLRSGNGRWQNMSMLDWAREAVGRGYVVLLLDALEQRGADTLCKGPKNDIFPSRGIRDALQAAAYMRSLPYVDPRRVAYAGYSWGAGVGLAVSSRQSAQTLGIAERYNAVVSFYPPCVYNPKTGAPYTTILKGIDSPLLVLLGGKDTETPPNECSDRLKPAQEAGEPVHWHLYSEATHCWDCKNLHGFKKVDAFRGADVEYLYDEAVTRDSAKRMFEFIEKAFANRK